MTSKLDVKQTIKEPPTYNEEPCKIWIFYVSEQPSLLYFSKFQRPSHNHTHFSFKVIDLFCSPLSSVMIYHQVVRPPKMSLRTRMPAFLSVHIDANRRSARGLSPRCPIKSVRLFNCVKSKPIQRPRSTYINMPVKCHCYGSTRYENIFFLKHIFFLVIFVYFLIWRGF